MNIKELFNDALPVLRTFSPTIAAAIGGPFGVAFNYIIPRLANEFSADPNHLPSLVSSIVQDPNAREKLEKLEEDHKDIIDSLMNNMNNLAKAEINVKLEWQSNLK